MVLLRSVLFAIGQHASLINVFSQVVLSQLLHELGRNECEIVAQGVKYRPRKKQRCLRLRQKCMQRVVLLGAVPFAASGIHGVKPLLSSNKP